MKTAHSSPYTVGAAALVMLGAFAPRAGVAQETVPPDALHPGGAIQQASYEARTAAMQEELQPLNASLETEPPLCEANCNPCQDGSGCGLVGGYSFVFLKPRFQDNRAFTLRNSEDFPDEHNTKQNFDYDYELTPRLWLGWVGSTGGGTRVRYWQFDHASDSETFTDPGNGDFEIFGPETATATGGLIAGSAAGPGDSIHAFSGIDAYTIDAEVTQRIEVCHWRIDVGGGFRHASIEQDYTAVAIDAEGERIALSAVRHGFDGVGPTIFGEVHRQIGDGGLALFASGRASILFGDHDYSALDREFGAFTDTAHFEDDATLRIGEIQVGGEWLRELSCSSVLFVQVAWEAQIWEGSGNAADPTGDDLGLTGFQISLGVMR